MEKSEIPKDKIEEKCYPQPLPLFQSDYVKRQRKLWPTCFNRRFAPFVREPEKRKDSKTRKKYLVYKQGKRPEALMHDMNRLLLECDDLRGVLNETATVLRGATNSRGVTVFMVDESLEEIYQVTRTERKISYKICTGTTVAAHVASTKEFIKINDLLEDLRFPEGLGFADVKIKSVVAVPVITPEDDCIAVFILHREVEDPIYEDQHLRLVIVLCGWVGSTIYQNQQRLTYQKQQELNEYLLDLTKCYFSEVMDLGKIVTEVVNFAKIALNAEHGSFYIIRNDDGELSAEVYEEGIGEDEDKLFKKNIRMKLNKENDLITSVVKLGQTINIKNAYNDSRIEQGKRRGYVIRSLLIVPIKGVDEILGAIQIMNKKKVSCFTKSDEILFYTFSVYCGFVLSYARLEEKKLKNNMMNKVYSDMLQIHMQPCVHDYYFVFNHPDVSVLPPRFHQFDFYISDAFDHYMPQLLMYMFNEISKDMFETVSVLSKFVLIVQKSYHNHPYHNFYHAFNVAHSVYNMIRRNAENFTPIELRALILSAYCHDIDHYGVTNNFLEITNHFLSQLYDESVLENHHFHVTLFIIEFMKLFSFMSTQEYKHFISEVKSCILATDLSTYFKRRGKLYQICAEDSFNWNDDTHRSLLKSVMMTMADLSGLCKPFDTAKNLIDNVYKEFYNEGDKEKEMGLRPLSIMDREKTNMIPSDQVQFMTVVVLPCALILAKLLPNCAALYKEALKLREVWQEINDTQGRKYWTMEDFSPENNVDEDVEDT